MLANERHSYMLDVLNKNGTLRVTGVAQALNVSEMTIRRDIDQLAEQGLLVKVHGGATVKPGSAAISEPPFRLKSQREQSLKEAIGLKAAQLVQPAASLALMGGSTVYALAKNLVQIPRITVVTNSLPICNLFHREGRADQTVILAGGLRTPTDSFVGEIAVSVFAKLNVDLAFMGTHGMDIRGGFTSPNILEAETNRAVRAHAKRVVVLADHTKWGDVGFATFAQLQDADILVTDEHIDPAALEQLRSSIHQVEIA